MRTTIENRPQFLVRGPLCIRKTGTSTADSPLAQATTLIPLFAALGFFLSGSELRASNQFPHADARIKTASESAALEKPVYPFDAAMQYSQPRQFAILPSIPAGLVSEFQDESKKRGKALQIGLRRQLDPSISINASSTRADQWTVLSNGWRILSVQIASAGAVGLRLHLQNVALPPGARLVLYNPADSSAPGMLLDSTNSHDFWSPTVFAEQATLECQLPPGADSASVVFKISELSHLYLTPARSPFSKEGSCQIDVSCYPDYADAAKGVAMIAYVVNGNSFLCTGCLLATTHKTTAEYFLTARHCIHNQSEAATLEFYWLYQTDACDGTPPDRVSAPQTAGGGQLLATGISDFALVRLQKPAPTGVIFQGWSVVPPVSGEILAGIHHPDGSYKRICLGSMVDLNIYFWAVQWSSGVTEPGSSGSPLFNSSRQVIGQLAGGWDSSGSSCDNPTALDEYGRFDVTYPFIKKWIDPSGRSGGPAPVGATYSALFYDQANGVMPETSGACTITTTPKGKFSGKLQMGANLYPFSGILDANGNGNVTLKRAADLAPLAVHFQIDLPEGAYSLNGLVTDGNWTSTMIGERPIRYAKGTNSPFTGNYTLAIPGPPGSDIGNSYGMVIVNKTGRLTFAGMLADNSRAMQSSYVLPDGGWPLYLSLYGGDGYLFSWLNFNPTDAGDLSGQVYWNRSGTNNFSVVADSFGSLYQKRAAGTDPLAFSNGIMVLSGPDPTQDVQGSVQVNSKGKVIGVDGFRANVGIASANGLLNGTVTLPGSKHSTPVHGVVLQKQNLAEGYFSGGRVFLLPTPQAPETPPSP